jgi:DNA-binding HxlR family transcriptional regulator
MLLILLLLRREALRFNQLRHGIEGILQKMLSQVPRSLERDALVKRRYDAQQPATAARHSSLRHAATAASSIPEQWCSNREAAAYRIARSSRTLTTVAEKRVRRI